MTEADYPPPPKPILHRGPYDSSFLHLVDELERVEVLVRAQAIRWLLLTAEHKDPREWGMVSVSDLEVRAYLRSDFVPPAFPQADGYRATEHERGTNAVLQQYAELADRMASRIKENRDQTPEDVPLRLRRLERLYGLGPLERDILLVALLPEYDGRFRRLFGYMQDDVEKNRPTVELIWRIVQPAEHPDAARWRRAFDADGTLLANRLIVLDADPGGDAPLPWRLARLDDRVAAYLLGDDAIDGRLAEAVSWAGRAPDRDKLPFEDRQVDDLIALADWIEQQLTRSGVLTLLHGPRGSGRLQAARFLAAEIDRPLLVVEVARALRARIDWECLVALAFREAALCDAAIAWAGIEPLFDREQPPHRWQALLDAAEDFRGLTLLTSQAAWHPTGRDASTPFLHVEFPMPGYLARRLFWVHHLPAEDEFEEPAPNLWRLADDLASGFQLTEGQIRVAVATARWLAVSRRPDDPKLRRDDLFEACRRQSGGRLAGLARRIEPRPGLKLDDLVLPDANRRQFRELLDRIRIRPRLFGTLDLGRRVSMSQGLVALFTGPSGTGKTLGAELLAREQGVDLYKVDIASVVSKWVGDTPKNLAALFDEAGDSNAVILFDEADALFSKRGEVKEAQDRWANMEVNYLLQRIEEYSGVVVLTSNFRQNIDEAFLRRIHVILEFPPPDKPERLAILKGLLRRGLPHPDPDDLRVLADQFALTGGGLSNVVVDATFRALARAELEKKPAAITTRDLVLATAREYQKLGKPITRADFIGDFFRWVEEDIFLKTQADARRAP